MNRIRELRIEKELTQKDLAALLSINQTAVGKYERGELEPNLQSLKKLSHIFECTVDYIIGNSDDFGNVVVQNNSMPELRSVEKDLLACFRKLPEDLQRRATSYLKKLVELNEEELSPGDSKKFQ